MIEFKKEGLFIDGKRVKLFSGAMHYFRVLPEYWDDRFSKMSAAGFNAVETVMCWNLHEPKEGEFNFEGMLDIEAYIKSAKKHGLYIIIRPGPYTCGEWDFGGFPAWMLKDKNLRVRCNDEIYMSKVERYFKKLLSIITPHQITNGGNVIAMQIENEYGSYGNDKDYLMRLEKIMKDNGVNVPLFTSDGTCYEMLSGGTLPHICTTLNFGSRADKVLRILDDFKPNNPKICMEFWCGWFDHWGRIHHTRNANQVASEIKKMIASEVDFNIYMFHGGTNFNFWAGANYDVSYKPVVTSYDDAALLNEYGDYTPAYHKIREAILTARSLPLDTPLPPRPSLQNIGEVMLTEKADLWDSLLKLGEKHTNPTPESMEYFGQNFGYVLYRKKIQGKYGARTLYIDGVHDIAYVRINGKTVASYDRRKKPFLNKNDGIKIKIPAFDKEMLLEILVEGMGRINYGCEMENDRKGIQKVRLDYQTLFGWEIYTLPFDNLDKTQYTGAEDCKPAILRGKFKAEKGKDCFVDMKGFKKGFVTINGFNIGRYWSKGPQRTLYLPSPLLKDENEIIVVEQEGYKCNKVNIIDKHYL